MCSCWLLLPLLFYKILCIHSCCFIFFFLSTYNTKRCDILPLFSLHICMCINTFFIYSVICKRWRVKVFLFIEHITSFHFFFAITTVLETHTHTLTHVREEGWKHECTTTKDELIPRKEKKNYDNVSVVSYRVPFLLLGTTGELNPLVSSVHVSSFYILHVI